MPEISECAGENGVVIDFVIGEDVVEVNNGSGGSLEEILVLGENFGGHEGNCIYL